jgi:hypothetical protein
VIFPWYARFPSICSQCRRHARAVAYGAVSLAKLANHTKSGSRTPPHVCSAVAGQYTKITRHTVADLVDMIISGTGIPREEKYK